MDPRKSENAPADYVAMALSPALIMGLVGSLIFFLLEILYSGAYTARLQWILFFFVFGAVLVARISMQPDIASRANLYGGILGLLVWIGLLIYVEYPPGPAADIGWAINLGLIVLTWWCAHQLTWDCTFMDDRLGGSGKGVLQAAGFSEGGQPDGEDDEEEEKEAPQSPKTRPPDWLERYQEYRKKRSLKRTPGVWVVYFSLAALPIFGLGQALIPADAVARRRYTFWLMVVYVGSGLGLLLTTSFLGLRMYLRRRKLKMPAAMTGVWLALGGGLIALLLLGGALLPRPQAEYKVVDIGGAGSKSRQASRSNVKSGDPGEGEGKGEDAKDGKDKGKDKQGKDSRQGEKDKGGSGDKKDKAQGSGQKDRSGKDKDGKDKGDKKGGRSRDRAQKDRDQKGEKDEQKESDQSSEATPPKPPKESPSWFKDMAKVLKWVVFGLLALVVLIFGIRAVLQFFANFTDWARNLLDAFRRFWESLLGLFGRKKEQAATEGNAEEQGEAAVAAQPFSAFANPFADGRAEKLSVDELTRYTFAALQAWARERDLGRQPGETPLEFADRVGGEVPPLERDVQRLALLYARSAYARGGLPANSREVLEQFWETLLRTAEQPLST
jgi:hypothetical protein